MKWSKPKLIFYISWNWYSIFHFLIRKNYIPDVFHLLPVSQDVIGLALQGFIARLTKNARRIESHFTFPRLVGLHGYQGMYVRKFSNFRNLWQVIIPAEADTLCFLFKSHILMNQPISLMFYLVFIPCKCSVTVRKGI